MAEEQKPDDQRAEQDDEPVRRSTLKVVALVALLYVPVAALISLVIMPYYRNNVGP
jgi:hypothetical protein